MGNWASAANLLFYFVHIGLSLNYLVINYLAINSMCYHFMDLITDAVSNTLAVHLFFLPLSHSHTLMTQIYQYIYLGE